MTRTVVFGLTLVGIAFLSRGFVEQAEAKDNGWERFAEDLAELQAEVTIASMMMNVDVWRHRECRYQSLTPQVWSAREENLTAMCATNRWPVPGGLSEFMRIGACESGWNRFANNSGQYLGLFQHAAPYWSSRVTSLMPKGWRLGPWQKWTNSRSQIVTTARMAHSGGWEPWGCA